MSKNRMIEDPDLEYRQMSQSAGGPGADQLNPQPEGELKYIGKYNPRLDGREVVTGSAQYVYDLYLNGMLHGKILRSPHACADVVSIDLSQALNLPGVAAALKLQDGRVKWFGDQIAAVAAVDEQTAEDALKLIKVEYKVLPHVVSEDRAMEAKAPQVQDGGNVQKINEMSRGDVEKGFKEADVVFEQTYRTSWEVHQPTETHGSVARWDGDYLTVWDTTQAVQSVRDGLARALNIPASRVRVIMHFMGGGFGSKLGVNDHTVVAARLARETGRPVKIFLDRRENSYCVGYRPSCRMTYKAGVKKDGTLIALSLKNYTSGGTARGDRCDAPVDVYKIPNVKIEEYSVFLNACPSRATRAPGHTQGTFGLEGFLEELAAKIGLDPLELRMKNYSTKNQNDTGLPYSEKSLDQCYKIGAEKIGWAQRNKKPGGGSGKIRTGIGMASQIWPGAGNPGTLADLRIFSDGSIEVECGTQDIGCGTKTHIALVAADTLGLEPKDISVKINSSEFPWAPASGGSQTTPSVAPAVRDACLKAVELFKGLASKKLDVPPANIVFEKGKLSAKNDPAKAIDFKELARTFRAPAVVHGERAAHPATHAYQTFGAQFAQVEVDTETGKITVKKVVSVHDIGRVINVLTAESQVHGGVIQGMSAGLYEEKIMDAETGAMVNHNIHDYKIATAMDAPEIFPLFTNVPDARLNNLGTKGLGEPPRIPGSASVANAVFNAIGVHVREIPMTPAKVLAALKRKEARS